MMNFTNLKHFLVLIGLILSNIAFGQDDNVLFTVNERPVHLSEFTYIYLKNNGQDADYSEESLTEYLELYKKFKLKVEKARDMGLDTVQRLQNELNGYKKQLSSSYLVDKEVSEKLINEVVERKKTDVRISHIFIGHSKSSNAKPQAKEKITEVYEKLKGGASFEDLAKSMSEDKSSGPKGGDLGYNVAILPDGFYDFETAMYETKVGAYSEPVTSSLGWHIIKPTDRRPARSDIEASHILIKKEEKGKLVKGAKNKIDSIYQLYKSGEKFEALAKKYSNDKKTADKGGYLGYFKINQYESSFEDTAFELQDGDVSKPIETSTGWHIIRKLSTKDVSDDLKIKRQIQAGMSKSQRYSVAKKRLIQNLKTDIGVVENKGLLSYFTSSLTDEFFSYKWTVPDDIKEGTLLKIMDDEYSLKQFAEYCKKTSKERLRQNKELGLENAVTNLFNSYVDEKILDYEESQLPNKYPEFKALMREYEEGILLFEATKMKVWDKAGTDSVGLQKFYDSNTHNYTWPDRIKVEEYVINTADEKLAKAIFKKAKKSSSSQLVTEYNTGDQTLISLEQKQISKDQEEAQQYSWKADHISEIKKGMAKTKEPNFSFYKVTEFMPSRTKKLDEARGYIIADYQDVLEKEWIGKLKDEYPINVNDKVFNSLIKK